MADPILKDCYIIPRLLRDHAALQGLDNFDIDAPRNRIYLPGDPQLAAKMGMSSAYGGDDVHASYKRGVEGVLDNLAKIADPVARNVEVTTLQDALRVALGKGDVHM